MKIVSYNLFGLKSRKENLSTLIKDFEPDVICLQETHHPVPYLRHSFLRDYEIQHLEPISGKGEGVGILSSAGLEIIDSLPEYQKTFRNAVCCRVGDYFIVNLHAPWKYYLGRYGYNHKQRWFEEMKNWIMSSFNQNDKVILSGDFNINYDVKSLEEDYGDYNGPMIGSRPLEISLMESILDLGFTDAFQYCGESYDEGFTWRDPEGVGKSQRIDYFLCSNNILDELHSCKTLTSIREREDASDHIPLMLELN